MQTVDPCNSAAGFPVLEKASFEQALRWVAFGLPPLAPQHERIEDYPEVASTERFPVVPEAKTSLQSLLRKLALGEISAEGVLHQLVVESDGPRWVPVGIPGTFINDGDTIFWIMDDDHLDYRDLLGAIPSERWAIESLAYAIIGTDCDEYSLASENEKCQFLEIAIKTEDLFRAFPRGTALHLCGKDQEKASPDPADAEPAKGKRGRPPNVPREVWLERLAVLALAGIVTKDASQDAVAQAVVDELRRLGSGHKVSVETVRKDWIGPLLREAKERPGGN